MLIKALCDYADKLEEKAEFKIPDGWAEQDIHFRIMLAPDGEITDIIDVRKDEPYFDKKGNQKYKKVPRKAVLPIRTQKTGIDPNIIEHRPLYIFGLNYDKDEFTPDDKTNKAKKSHEAFVKFNLDFFDDLDSEICTAYKNFVKNWTPENSSENPLLKQLSKDYKNSYYGFALTGAGGNLEDDMQFRQKYDEYYRKTSAENEDELITCGIMGKKLPAARLHDKIKFPGGNSVGSVLVGMNDTAFESYCKVQSYNSGISKPAMKKYTSALNSLLSDKNHRIIIDDLVVVYFAIKSDDSAECSFFSMCMGEKSDKADDSLHGALKDAPQGKIGDIEYIEEKYGVDKDVTFYIAGLTPNSSRISQKFIYKNKFGEIIKNLQQHQEDLKIAPDSKQQIYFSWIKKELISPKSSNEKVPPPLMTSVMLSAFNGTKYPRGLLETVIRRVKTDSDDDKNHYIKINDTRVGIIKACINRQSRLTEKKEEITMALNKENKDPAYLCGRLFAVYEKIQQDSSGGGLNRTIKDSYFSSACSRPSAIITKLSQLSQNHMRKLDERAKTYNRLIGEIMDGLNGEFPKTLDLDSQGKFIIGYYQQNKDLYTSNKTNDVKDGKED